MPKRWFPFKDTRTAQAAFVGQPLQRAFKVSKADIDVEGRTVKMALTSDEPVLHWVSGRGAAYIILDHGEKAKNPINLERMQNGMALLENHDPNRLLGRIRDGVSDGHVLRATGRFSKFNRGAELWPQIQEDLEHGDSPGTSAWFEITRLAEKIEGYIDEFPVIRAIKWTILEGSVASVEADTRSGIGRTRRAADPEDECDAEDPEDCEMGDDCPVHGKGARTQRQPRRKTMECKARSAELCADDNCEDHAVEKLQRLKAAPTQLTPEQLIAKRQAEYTGWVKVLADTPEETDAYTQLARDYGRDESMTLDMFKAAIERAKTAARAAVNTAKPPQTSVVVPGRRTHSLRVFKGEGGDLRAYRFMQGFYANACFPRNQNIPALKRAFEYAKEHGLLQRAGQTEADPEAGGFTVQDEWSPEIIDLHEEFGVFRRYAGVEPMAAETKSIRRREGGLKFHAAGEGQDVEVEKKKWGAIKLVAKKWLCMAKISSELNEDSMVNQGDDLAYEMTLAWAELEDNLGFLADGTGSSDNETGYQGVIGIIPKILGLNADPTKIAGLVIAHGTPGDASEVPLVFGDLRLGARLGDRSALTISMSEHSSFANDEIDLKGRVRDDVNIHSVGNAANAVKDRKAGAILALATDQWAAVTSDHLNELMGRVPRFGGIRPSFFCHQAFYYQVLYKILKAAGGATPADIAGAGPFQFGGFPVVFTQNLQHVSP